MSFKLPRFLRDFPIVDSDKGTPTISFHQWWETVLKQIEATIVSIQDALEAAGIALEAAEVAQTAADAAIASASSVETVAKLSTSGMSGLTLTATDAGTDATVTVSNHTRVYGDGTFVSVTGAPINGLAYSTLYVIYYSDPTFAGGAVTYQTSTDTASVSQTGGTHIVGLVTTPASGMPDNTGAGQRPPGFSFDLP